MIFECKYEKIPCISPDKQGISQRGVRSGLPSPPIKSNCYGVSWGLSFTHCKHTANNVIGFRAVRKLNCPSLKKLSIGVGQAACPPTIPTKSTKKRASCTKSMPVLSTQNLPSIDRIITSLSDFILDKFDVQLIFRMHAS